MVISGDDDHYCEDYDGGCVVTKTRTMVVVVVMKSMVVVVVKKMKVVKAMVVVMVVVTKTMLMVVVVVVVIRLVSGDRLESVTGDASSLHCTSLHASSMLEVKYILEIF